MLGPARRKHSWKVQLACCVPACLLLLLLQHQMMALQTAGRAAADQRCALESDSHGHSFRRVRHGCTCSERQAPFSCAGLPLSAFMLLLHAVKVRPLCLYAPSRCVCFIAAVIVRDHDAQWHHRKCTQQHAGVHSNMQGCTTAGMGAQQHAGIHGNGQAGQAGQGKQGRASRQCGASSRAGPAGRQCKASRQGKQCKASRASRQGWQCGASSRAGSVGQASMAGSVGQVGRASMQGWQCMASRLGSQGNHECKAGSAGQPLQGKQAMQGQHAGQAVQGSKQGKASMQGWHCRAAGRAGQGKLAGQAV